MIKFSKILVIFSWVLLIFTAINKPFYDLSAFQYTYLDKIVHFFLFGILSFLIIKLFRDSDFKSIACLAVLISIFYSIFCEYWQIYVPGRYSDMADILFAIFGIIIFTLLSGLLYNKPKMLLHICCAGCGVYASQVLQNKYNVTLYFYNPNIFPKNEYQKRLDEVKEIAKLFNIKLISERDYTHDAWLKKIKGLESAKEGDRRCEICYKDRLYKTLEKARELKFNYFTTTLTMSPHKSTKLISEIGISLASNHKVKYLNIDFKKNDGFKKSVMMSKALNLYRQNYCGCEFSQKKVK